MLADWRICNSCRTQVYANHQGVKIALLYLLVRRQNNCAHGNHIDGRFNVECDGRSSRYGAGRMADAAMHHRSSAETYSTPTLALAHHLTPTVSDTLLPTRGMSVPVCIS
jgi:hypothetical protein